MPANSSDLPPSFEDDVHSALALWHKDASAGGLLDQLTLVRLAMAEAGRDVRLAANRVLQAALNALERDYAPDAQLLRRRFVDEAPAFLVARELSIAEATLFRRQRLAIDRLTRILYDQELAARRQRASGLAGHVQLAPQAQLIALDRHVQDLSRALLAEEPPWLMSLEGIGGIGKTTLARLVARRLVVDEAAFADFIWVSAQQEVFHPGGFLQPVDGPALTVTGLIEALAAQLLPAGALPIPFSEKEALDRLNARLHEQPCLLVIDNLETLADAETLLPVLRKLSGRSRFLLTSRKSLRAEPDIFCFTVPELTAAGALQLLRNEALVRNLESVTTAGDADLLPIFETVGGNPLALKLIAGQLYLLELQQVLDNLRAARGKKAEDLYRFIYLQAWQGLDEDGREVLLNMPLFAQSGADFASIERVSDVKGSRLLDALERLALLSLVTIAGDLHARRYSIHRLTETFLLTDIIGWPGRGWSD